MKVRCNAPGCSSMVDVNRWEQFRKKMNSLLHGRDFHAPILCPEHLERITSGGVSDNDPTTNPDLEK